MKQYWMDNEGGVYMNAEYQMQNLVENGIIESYKPLTQAEFKQALVGE